MTMIKIKLLALFLSSVSIINPNNNMSMAMVINVPVTTLPTVITSTSSDVETATNTSIKSQRKFRIRRTRVADLDAISSMLAMEAVPSRDTWNWNDDMNRLRTKSQFRQQLGHRLAAIEEGRETAKRLCGALDSESEVDTCHLLWQNDNLRSKIRAAVAHSREENAWLLHNFDQTPSSDMLNHAMMSVEEISSGGVVGFCEVAWLPSPTIICSIDYDMASTLSNNNSQPRKILVSEGSLKIQSALSSHYKTMQTHSCAPAIVNLVTSPSHRRMGIASRLINFVSKFTKVQCWSTSLGLYVHPQNEAALKLYSLKEFSVMTSKVENGLLYLTQRRQLEDK